MSYTVVDTGGVLINILVSKVLPNLISPSRAFPLSIYLLSLSLTHLQVLVCVEHEQERLQFYCRSCQHLLCPLCKLRRAHSGHKIIPIALAYQTLKVSVPCTLYRAESLDYKQRNNAQHALLSCIKWLFGLIFLSSSPAHL